MSDICPIVSGEARRIDRWNFNLYCSAECDAVFPAECNQQCGWPIMRNTTSCVVRRKCPCMRATSEQARQKMLAYVQAHNDFMADE